MSKLSQTITESISAMSNSLLTNVRPVEAAPASLGIRDHLAVDRTVLANERTLLAYIRTAIGFFVLGLTFLHFLDEAASHITTWIFLSVGGIVFVIGLLRFARMKCQLGKSSVQQRIATDRS